MEDDPKTVVRFRCSFCFRRRVISYHLTVLLPLIVLLSTVCTGMCPTRCHCNDDDLHASCSSANLQVVPIQLNPELKHINLSHNKINNVHFTLDIYANLITLDLSYNKVQKLGSMNFISQVYLEELTLRSNEIESLEKDAFTGLVKLLKLDLSSNEIEEIFPNAFSDLQNLQILLLNSNKLVSFEAQLFRHQRKLEVLQLDDNQLLEIPSDNLKYTIELTHLSMSRNLIETILENSLSNLHNLQKLLFDSNVISTINDRAFDGFNSLGYLNLADNNLTQIPTNQLSKLSNLYDLDLSGNFFDQIPPVAFRGLFHLKTLRLNGVETLERVDFRAFVDNINLEIVSMNDNIVLGSIPTRLFHGNPKIQHISIQNNFLQTLEASHFPLDHLQTLEIGNNPLECNCSLIWLWKLVTDQKHQASETYNSSDSKTSLFLDVDRIKCASPEEISNILLTNLPESEIKCSPNWLAVATGTATVIFVVTVVLIALVYSGTLRKCSGEKSYLRRSSGDTPAYPEQSNTDRQRSGGKCEHIIGPPLLTEYQTLPPWEGMYQGRKDHDMCRQFEYHAGHASRPHIVYV